MGDLSGIGSLIYNVQKSISYWKEADQCPPTDQNVVPLVPKTAADAALHVYDLYESKLRSMNAIELGDLVPMVVNLLESR